VHLRPCAASATATTATTASANAAHGSPKVCERIQTILDADQAAQRHDAKKFNVSHGMTS
jgi:hypothetical protein